MLMEERKTASGRDGAANALMADHPLAAVCVALTRLKMRWFFVLVFLRKLVCGLTGYRVLFTGPSEKLF